MENTTSEGAGSEPAHIDIDSLSESEISQALESLKNPPPVVETVPESVTEPQTAEVEETPPEPVETDSEDDEEDLDKSKRFRLSGPDRKYAALIKEGVKPADAFRLAYPGEVIAQETVTPQDETPDRLLTASELIEQQIDQLSAQQKDHLEMFENEEAAKLSIELAKLQKQYAKEIAKETILEEQKVQAAKAEVTAIRDEWANKAVAEYPAFGQEGTPFYQRAQEIHDYLVQTKDVRVNEPDYAFKLAQWTAKDLDVLPAIPTKVKPAATPAASPKVVKPQPGLLATSSPTPMASVDVDAALENLSTAELTLIARAAMERAKR